ncbi:MAG: HAMP domain-containing histidine kinase [Lachnospiraceae bacterium]|nr:HAMP domain-containing histidine kinase [Lachnospiraceae bacterium]
MATKWKNSKAAGILLVLALSMLAGVVMCNLYPFFREQAARRIAEGLEEEAVDETSAEEIVLEVDEEYARYLLSSICYLDYEITPDTDAFAWFTQNYDADGLTVAERERLTNEANQLMANLQNQYVNMQGLNGWYGYAVNTEKSYGSGGLSAEISGYEAEDYGAVVVISYDSRGVPSIISSRGMLFEDTEGLGYLTNASMSVLLENNGMAESNGTGSMKSGAETTTEEVLEETDAEASDQEVAIEGDSADSDYGVATDSPSASGEITIESSDASTAELLQEVPLPKIQNATFVFGVYTGASQSAYVSDYYTQLSAYRQSGYTIAMMGILLVMLAFALLLQNIPALRLREVLFFRLPSELSLFLAFCGISATFVLAKVDVFVWHSLSGGLVDDLSRMGFGNAAPQAATGLLWILWSLFALGWYWMGASMLPYLTHPIRTLKERTLCIGVCRWIKKKWLKLWNWATEVRLDEKKEKALGRLIMANALLALLFGGVWLLIILIFGWRRSPAAMLFSGILWILLYSTLLYVLAKRKWAGVLSDYEKLLRAANSIAEGRADETLAEEMGVFEPVRAELGRIQDGFQKAVREEVRSRNTKAELITNVSHDLKTPLTAIITYVDLLKKEDLTEEERRSYVATLEQKSQRLKVLIEDLFEVSRAATGDVVMNYDEVDLVNLIKQVHLENEDKIRESPVDFRWNLPEEKCVLRLDPQRSYRIIDNLLQNILKYAMPQSRAYIELQEREGKVTVSFKNMSAVEMNFTPEEITERFTRGDLSRGTEGSGLGLAIAQSFTELQGGEFKVETDGDLFKVMLTWNQ